MTARRSALALLLAASGCLAQGSGLFVHAEAQPDDCVLGERLTYRASATVPDGLTEGAEPLPPAFEGFRLVGGPETRRFRRAAATITEWTYTLTADRTGTFLIQPFAVRYRKTPGGALATAESERISVRIRSRRAARDIRPAKNVVDVPDATRPYRLVLLGLAGLALVAAVAAGVDWLLRHAPRRPPPPPIIIERPPPPAHVVALRRLRELESEDLPGRGLVDIFHVRLSTIFRDYLSARYHVAAQESTTSEISESLYAQQTPEEVIGLCRGVLLGCDLEKFAGYRPGREEMDDLLRRVRALIRRTTLAEQGGDGGESW